MAALHLLVSILTFSGTNLLLCSEAFGIDAGVLALFHGSMHIYGITDRALRLLFPVALCLTVHLYLYPLFHGCVFPTTDGSPLTAWTDSCRRHLPSSRSTDANVAPTTAPFRLLALADPQLEGDSSLPKPEDAFFAKLKRHWSRLCAEEEDKISCIADVGRSVTLRDIPEALAALRKQVDLFGNDYYLGHIFRTLNWWTKPTHITVLGDLLGSQWVTDEEFEWRGWRYWNRVFPGGHRVEDTITTLAGEEEEKVFDLDNVSWTNSVINIAGNHDIGYAGDISRTRMDRFERDFGTANWDVRFQYPQINSTTPTATPSLHLIILNSLILDTPTLSDELRSETFDYLNGLISRRMRPVEDRSSFTLLLTHLPLHKKEGICVDAPFFDYWGDDDGGGVYKPHGLREQNHLSKHTSQHGTLQALFGMSGNVDGPAQGKGRNGLILTGHDHEGCDTWHYIPSDSAQSSKNDEQSEKIDTQWEATQWQHADHSNSHTGVREITLRSMMGDYGGNAGLLSAWYDFEYGEWKYDILVCGLNLKLWWATHILDLVVLALWSLNLLSHFSPAELDRTEKPAISSSEDKKSK